MKFMSELIKVSIADYQVAFAPNQLITLGLGSCIGVCVYDKKNKIGGLAHIMLPYAPKNQSLEEISYKKYADIAIEMMVNEIIKKGAMKNNMEAKIIGGANMFEKINPTTKDTIGFKNQMSVKESLKKMNIPIVAEELGGSVGRTVIFDLEKMTVSIRAKGIVNEI